MMYMCVMTENNLTYIVRCERLKPPDAKPLVMEMWDDV